MIHRNRRADWRRIKTLYSYTIEEAATALNVHRNAIRYWIKKSGLLVLADRRPHLIPGGELVSFLKNRREARRRRCGPGQFFCLKCRRPQSAVDGTVDYRPLSALRGVLIGVCPACETRMQRFMSLARLRVVARDFNLQLRDHEESLKDTVTPSLSCHFHGED
jgi:hypothetical protein